MSKFKNAYSEVYEILKYLNEEDKLKIPEEVRQAINYNRNKEYIFEYDENIDLMHQNLKPETRAVLFNLFRDYLATPRQKDIIVKMQIEERKRKEEKKRKMYWQNHSSSMF